MIFQTKRNDHRNYRRRLSLEHLEARRVFAGLVFESALTTENADPTGRAFGADAVLDSLGNTYASGYFRGTVDFDRMNVHADNRDLLTATAPGVDDGYLAKYNPQGRLEWVRQIAQDWGVRVTVDGNDQPIASLQFENTITIDGQTRTSSGTRDALVAKFDDQGQLQWMESFGFDAQPSVLKVEADSWGRVTAMASVNGGDTRELSIRQFNSDGELLWVSDFGTGDFTIAQQLLVSSDGSLLVSGRFIGTVDIDPTIGEHLLIGSTTERNDFIAKFSPAGQFDWATTFRTESVADPSTTNVLQSPKIVLGNDGSLVFLDGYQGDVSIVSSTGSASLPYSTANRSVFGKLDQHTGALIDTALLAGFLAPMDNGIVAIVGGYAIGGHTGSSGFNYLDGLHVPTLGGNDVYVVTLSEEGNANWAGLIGGTGNDFLSGFHSDDEGGVLLAGFSYSTTFDYEPTQFVESEVSNVGSYVVRLQPRRPGGQVILFEHDFEPTTWSTHWVQDSQMDWFRSTQRKTLGGYAAEVDGSASNATLTTAGVIDLSGLETAALTFDWLIESGFDAGEYISLDVSTNGGATWIQDVRRLSGNVSVENVWHSEVVDLTPYLSSQLKVRFRAKVSASDEDANVDNVRITGIEAGPNTPPVANAGSGYSMNEGGAISLSGAGSYDPDGSIASYAWDLDNDSQYDDAAGPVASFATTQSGTHIIGLLVTDNRGATATVSTQVIVDNVAPTANAGPDQTVPLGSPAALSAAGSTDPGNDIVDYLWDLDDDGLFDDAAGVETSVQPTATGYHTIRVQVTDVDGATSIDTMQLLITEVPSETTLFEDSFEVAEWNGQWVEDSQNDWFRSTQRATQGTRSAEVDGLARNATLTMGSGVNLSGYSSATLTFDWLIESGFDAGEFLALDISTDGGVTWIQDIRRLNGDVSLENVWQSETVDLSGYASGNLKIRFRSTVSGSSEDANVDTVRIVASHSSTSQAADAVFALAAGNANPQGIADPPPVGSLSASRLTGSGPENSARDAAATVLLVPVIPPSRYMAPGNASELQRRLSMNRARVHAAAADRVMSQWDKLPAATQSSGTRYRPDTRSLRGLADTDSLALDSSSRDLENVDESLENTLDLMIQ